MNKFWKVAGIATLVAVVGVMAVAGFALAQEPTDKPEGGHGPGPGFGMMGGGDWIAFDAAAEALELSPEQLFTELHAGKTLTDLAAEKGVDLQAVQDAMEAARQEAMQQAIEQAVTDGKISREQADWMLQGLEQGCFVLAGKRTGVFVRQILKFEELDFWVCLTFFRPKPNGLTFPCRSHGKIQAKP